MELGPGVSLVSETQLSAATQKSCRGQLACLGRSNNRQVRTHFGAPAPLRAQSAWAGGWTGVATMSDFPSRPVRVPWPPGVYNTGRVAIAQHHIHSMPLLTAVVYGVPRSQAHPCALVETEQLLAPLTKEVVLGRHGPRIIAGDFNHPSASLQDIALWKERGWQEIQDIARDRWGATIEKTCKGATQHDYIWLSPEAIALCQGSQIHHIFADHVVLEAKLCVPHTACNVFTWPRPATIPWEDVDVETWHATAEPYSKAPVSAEPTQWFQEFSQHWEHSVAPHVAGPTGQLPRNCKGRAARTAPAHRAIAPSVLKASRPGEVCMASDLLGREVKRWFQQLRRLQNLRSALRGGKQSPQALEYRRLLWQSILEAKGFTPNFVGWWPGRPAQLQGAPVQLESIPEAAAASLIYEDFLSNYRKLERWHLKR